ncbi:hypothetical protein NQ314_017169 [Rhamnusium bicolor]|uniref:Uncharacterized protein n=1 Tax=Rhamnusium bicolor TaxID=1586634 RepID=A0AAV8WUE4_9CUCU|nr:hypothetical protein NQ314_017169 [Rhamnusium bicolor]
MNSNTIKMGVFKRFFKNLLCCYSTPSNYFTGGRSKKKNIERTNNTYKMVHEKICNSSLGCGTFGGNWTTSYRRHVLCFIESLHFGQTSSSKIPTSWTCYRTLIITAPFSVT